MSRTVGRPNIILSANKRDAHLLWAEAAVHVPEPVMRQSASGIAHECFSLSYQIPLSLVRGGPDITAA
jgi:hypothetical protein